MFINSAACGDAAATVVAFSCAQPPPAALPQNFPATAVSFAFDTGGFYTTGAVVNVDEALNRINGFLGCFPDVCNLSPSQVLVSDAQGTLVAQTLSETLTQGLAALLPGAGEFLLNFNGDVTSRNFNAEVTTAIGTLLNTSGEVLMGGGINGVQSVNLCTEVLNCLGGASSTGEFLINQGGIITAVDFTNAVGSALASAPQFCTQVTSCIATLLAPGEVLGNIGGSIGGVNIDSEIESFVTNSGVVCDRVESCVLALLGAGEVLLNQGGTLTGENFDVLVANSLSTTTTSAALCTEVFACLDANATNGDFFINQGGATTATNFEAAVTAVVNGLPANGTFSCADVVACLGGGLGTGEVYYNDGTGTAPTNFAGLIPAATNQEKVYQVEFGQSGGLTVDPAFADIAGHQPLPSSVATNREIAAMTYSVGAGGDVDIEVIVGSTTYTFTGLSGSGALAIPGGAIAILGEPLIKQRISAVNTAGTDFVLSVWVKYQI